jgi:hypothetical protein
VGEQEYLKKMDFTFDAGPTVITAPYLINELFELFKKKPQDYIELKAIGYLVSDLFLKMDLTLIILEMKMK